MAVDIDFFPGLLLVVALFSTSGRMQVFDFGSVLEMASTVRPTAIPSSPGRLVSSLLDLIQNAAEICRRIGLVCT